MSTVAEFARRLHEESPRFDSGPPRPIEYPSREHLLGDIRAVIFDVYGTLLNYWRPEFVDPDRKMLFLLRAFRMTADFFKAAPALAAMDTEHPPEETLRDLYHGLIALNHDKSLKKGITYPEVRIEEVWLVIIMMLRRHGYDPSALDLGEDRVVAQCMAYYYNFHALGHRLYPDVVPALVKLRERNMVLGIVSNAQFYTPIDLTLLIRDQSRGEYEDYSELFEPDLIVFSFEQGYAKPNPGLFRRLYDALYEAHILPAQTVFVGNDLLLDIKPAQAAGMRTAFFAGDEHSAFLHDVGGTVIPDISFGSWNELVSRISFHKGKGS